MKRITTFAILTLSASALAINTGGQRGLARTLSAHSLGHNGLVLGAGGVAATDDEYVAGSQTPVDLDQPAMPLLISGNVFAAWGIAPVLDISIDFPLYADIVAPGEQIYGIGDLGVAAKVKLPYQRHDAVILNSYYIRGAFPTGKNDAGFFPRHAYYIDSQQSGGDNVFTANKLSISPVILWTLDFMRAQRQVPLQIHLNFGGVITEDAQDNAFIGRFAIQGTPAPAVTLFAELAVESRLRNWLQSYSPENIERDPAWVSPGVIVRLPGNLDLLVAGDFGISSPADRYRTEWQRDGYRYSTAVAPRFGGRMHLTWSIPGKAADIDGDGIADSDDACPEQAEDADGYEDDDGCPDVDNDGDGVIDERDACPAEVAACDGCPVRDADNDGILDDQDSCEDQAEDRDGFEDNDGCPDPDNDKDGIEDGADQCPDKPEDRDQFDDEDGCPDPDNDGDGIADDMDACPKRPGSAEADGCPARKIKRGRLILKGVHFESGKATLTPNSYSILDEVFQSLREWPDVKIEIRGFTDSVGSSAVNKRLSRLRAASVRDYLTQKGIDPARIRAAGYGEQDPIAPNTTAEGRAQNRRVEIHRID